MKRFFFIASAAILTVAFGFAQTPGRNSSPAASVPVAALTPRALLNQYCITCHNEKLKTGNLALDKLDVDHVGVDAETWEKVVRKLRAGMMPPAGLPRPAKPVMSAFLSGLEASLDRAAAVKPNPGAPMLHRMNRSEYANSIRDLIAVDIDAANLLPADDSSEGFDNIADVLGVSPALLERYIAAAAKISRLAIGDPDTSPAAATYKTRGDLSQNDQLEGLPAGTRGGMLIHHTFPLDGEYNFRVSLLKGNYGWWGEAAKGQQIEVAVNGERVVLEDLPSHVYYYLRPAGPAGQGRGGPGNGTPSVQFRIPMKAGPQTIGVDFIKQDAAAVDDIFQRFDAAGTNDLNLGYQYGFTTVPHIASLDITGPYNATGPGDTPSRRRIFVCHPTSETDEIPCARKIISTLARRAYRRPIMDADTEDLLSFYQAARNKGAFDTGIEMVLRRVLADPEFVFRYERDSANLPPGAAHRVSDLELASRLSFFLWSSIPDDELLDLAIQGKLKDPAILQRQVRRMLADGRSQAMVTNFAGQWLYLRELKNSSPDSLTFPDFDDNLRQAFQRETELFFQSIVHEDRSVLDLLNADYTFVNERLAKHYGIPNVYGNEFRRVTLENYARRGLLGQGSILLVTSVANRTSPVARGKWILENILGSPPPLPPPNVPPLKENAIGTVATSVRERMEEHRANPVCASCHKLMDPIGFSLENFDAVGHWRDIDSGFKIDATGQLVDGSKLDGPASLRKALLNYPDAFVGTMTEKLLMYAVGRELHYYDMPVVRGIMANAARNDLRFSSIVLGIVKSAPFQMRVKPEDHVSAGTTITASAR
jgi:hypothetical protein